MADSIEVTEVVVHATAGASVGAALREAIALAANEWRNVRLIHNNKEYRVNVNGNAKRCPAQAVFHLVVIFIDGGFNLERRYY